MQCVLRLKNQFQQHCPTGDFFLGWGIPYILYFLLYTHLLRNLCNMYIQELPLFSLILIYKPHIDALHMWKKISRLLPFHHSVSQLLDRISFTLIESQCLKEIEGKTKVIATDTAYNWSCFQKSDISALLSILRVHNS